MTPAQSSSVARQDINEVVPLLLAGLLSEADASRSLDLDTGELESLLGELGLSDAAMVPIEIDDELNTHFVDLGRSEFASPLFDDAVDQYLATNLPETGVRFRLTANRVLETDSAPWSPAGLILHVGRCGSTLLCNLLASADGCVALKEPEFVNRLLMRLAAEPDPVAKDRVGALIERLLRSLAHGIRFDADGNERACVVKLTSWNAVFADAFVSLLDPIPLVVVTRDPWATVASFLHDPPYWYEPQPSLSTARLSGRARRLEAAGVFARAWAQTVERTLRFPGSRTLFVSYVELVDDTEAVLRRVSRHLGDGYTGPNIECVRKIKAQYSKGERGERFQPIGKHERDPLPEEVRDLVTTITSHGWSELIGRTPQAQRFHSL